MGDLGERRRSTLDPKENLGRDRGIHSKEFKLTIVYTNARSVIKKMDELKVLACDIKPEIIAITETWTNETITNEYLQIPNYILIARADRCDTNQGRGGGVLMYARADLRAFQKVNDSDFNQFCEIQIEIQGEDPLIIYTVYRSPNSSGGNNEKLIDLINKVKHPSILVGDFNLPGIHWETNTSNSENQDFLEATQENFLTQHIHFGTQTSGNTLDLLLTTSQNMVLRVRDEGKLGNSDHSIIVADIKVNLTNKSDQKILNLARGNFDQMRNNLSKIDWNNQLLSRSVEENWIKFKGILEAEVKNDVPLKRRRNKNKPIWMNTAFFE